MTNQQVIIATQMLDLRDTMKRLYGDRWDEVTADHRRIIAGAMAESGNDNPLSAVIPVAKKMSAAGENPSLLMAVAVDMADIPFVKLPSGQSVPANMICKKCGTKLGISPNSKGAFSYQGCNCHEPDWIQHHQY
jgi:hypothetical protein